MRRGLISWSRAELPECVLDARVAAAQRAMTREHLDGLVVYTTPARAAAVSWLAGFVPYWNQGLLVIPRKGRPILVSALSNRVADWLQLNAHVAAVHNSPNIGAQAASFVATSAPRARIGVVDLPALPSAIIAELTASGHSAIDATPLMAALRADADPADIALHARAAGIANRALDIDASGLDDTGTALAQIEIRARSEGAEEVYAAVATNLATSRALVRIEGTRALSDTFAIRISLSYKGAWVRLTRTFNRTPAGAARNAAAAQTFSAAVATLPVTSSLATNVSWLVEATRTTMPLEPLAGSIVEYPIAIEPGQIVNVQAAIAVDDHVVLLGGPAIVGRGGAPSCLLVAPA